jgi:dimethylamine corrinoid protein
LKDYVVEEICSTISQLENSGKVKKLVSEAIDRRIPVREIVAKGLRRGLKEVGKKYAEGEYFLSELLFSASLMNDAMKVLKPHIGKRKLERQGTIVLATVKGDIHDIGKNIFGLFAEASGFDVYDLGVDVGHVRIVEEVKEVKPDILALSALLTTTRNEMKVVIDLLVEETIRDGVKVLIGGNAVTKEFAIEIGADAAALDAVEGVEICRSWVRKR